jgi:TRAP transporter 4TM/12TM fusion protein
MQKTGMAETTRYESLPTFLKVLFIVLSSVGMGLAVFRIFHLSIMGYTLLDYGYYYLLFAIYLSCAFLILPARKKDRRVPWFDLVAITLIFGIAFYFFLNSWEIMIRGWVPPSPGNFLLACILILAVLEGARRMGGKIYLVIALVIGLYPLIAEHMPGVLWGRSFSIIETVGLHVFGSEGLVGLPSRVMGDLIIGFLIFAGVLIASGAGDFFMKLATAFLGRFRGGPAKVAVVASGFFGSLSGSALSNVASTGSFTIPMMKRLGYPSDYAGAIEACASTGGVLMPPVMGAVAFIMCVVLGMEYAVIMVAAAIPAILYYWGLLLQVDLYAAKAGLSRLPQEEIPSIRQTLREGWPFLFVLAFLVWGLAYMRWEAQAPFYASGLMILLSFTSKKTRLTPKRIVETIAMIGKLVAQTMAIVFPIGLIIVGLTSTGVSAALTATVVSLGGETIIIVLAVGAIACYILGMIGLLAPAYIFLAVTLAPSVIVAGNLNELSVHLFIMYYAMLSLITPPVALAAFLASTIAGANAMKTGFRAMRLGIVLYFIPFFFVFNPALILQDSSLLETLWLFIQCLLGIALIAAGLEGYIWKVGKIGWLARLLLGSAGFLIAFPDLKTTLIGVPLALLTIAIILILRRRPGKVTAIAT